MASIAVKYYSTPDAAQALYDHNGQAFHASYERNTKASPSLDKARYPEGKNTIFEDTVISLPTQLVSARSVIYPRRHEAMNDDDAGEIVRNKKVLLKDAMKPLSKLPWIKTPEVPPSQGTRQVVAKGAQPANREPTPAWYSAPRTEWQTCAKAVCEKYLSLCYYECLFVAKRFSDADVSCSRLPDKLPYEVDAERRQDCSAELK